MILRDPVHGLIAFDGEVESVVVRLLDTREVQRLRRIRSLGAASLAFPGAEHSRFAHAIGSAHVMKRYLQRVARLSSDIPQRERIEPDDARVALAAALLHDLGHGPYSHTFEAVVPGALAHEDWTSRILLDRGSEVNAVLRSIDPTMPAKVERLIHGEHPIGHLARAVSGTFDVDRCDYLLRDSHMTGVRYGLLDLDWLLESTSSQMPLAMDTAARLFDSGKEFWMCASRGDDYSPGYFSPQKENWLDIIRASSAIPGFYRTGALLDGIIAAKDAMDRPRDRAVAVELRAIREGMPEERGNHESRE